MPASDKFLGMLGLCAKAGRLVSGDEAVRIAVKRGNAHLVIVDAAASANTQERQRSLCAGNNAVLITVEADLGHAIGREGRKVVAITDKVFADSLYQIHVSAYNA